jgi:hypothetical protein
MKGRRLVRQTSASDCAHIILGCLFHDIGFVRGILEGDGEDGYVINATGDRVKLPRGASDAALMPHHVDRSKLYVLERISHVEHFDAARIANAIEYTRFPSPAVDDGAASEEGMLLRAADLIGQLGGSALSTQGKCFVL